MKTRTTAFFALAFASMSTAQSDRVIVAGSIGAGGSWDIVRMQMDGSNMQTLVGSAADEYGHDLDASGTRLLYNSDATGTRQVYEFNLATRATRQLTFFGENIFPRWSPDGTRILFTHAPSVGARADLCIMDSLGANIVNITNSPSVHDAIGEWSPNGQRIVFSSGVPDGGINIFTISPSGSSPFQVTNLSWDEYHATWSADGSQIAFHGNLGNWDIFKVNSNGTGLMMLTNFGGPDQAPGWTPDDQILFCSHRNADSIFRMTSTGAGVTLVRQGYFTAPRVERLNPQINLSTLGLTMPVVKGGSTLVGTVSISGPAPSGGANVLISSSASDVAAVPALVTIPAGQTAKSFPIQTFGQTLGKTVTISARRSGILIQSLLVIQPALLKNINVTRTTVAGGTSISGTVSLDGPAPYGGANVILDSSAPTVVSLPAIVTVPGGAVARAFSVFTYSVASQHAVTITARRAGVLKTRTITVNP